MSAPKLTQDILKSLLTYDPETGVFVWKRRDGVKESWNTRYAGKVAGFDWSIGKVVYRSIRVFDWPFLGHRLAWLYMTGEWPPIGIDHKDTDGTNNRWANLRLATKSENAGNTGPLVTNKLGIRGVHQKKDKFHAWITIAGQQKYLGAHCTAAAAAEAYKAAAKEKYGEFAWEK